jgi:hypothetical protein
MSWNLFSVLAACAVACAVACSAVEGAPPPGKPGFDGPVPSGEAQMALKALRGKVFTDRTGALGGGGLFIISGFAVVPNPVTGKGPIIVLNREQTPSKPQPFSGPQGKDGYYWVVVETDADVADFLSRVNGAAAFKATGTPGKAYLKTIGAAPK